MTRTDPILAKLRSICLGLPDTKETPTWGSPHFRVGDKIFAGYGDHGGCATIGFKLTKEHADAVIHDARFERAPYVGRYGWVSMSTDAPIDWKAVRSMIEESYALIAPKPKAAKKPAAAAKKRAAPSGPRAPRRK
jgi:predicted DNA-binding protein (MmcQ/YjbR family)